MPWVPVGAAVFALPCCVLVLLELAPGTPFPDHVSGAFTLLGAGLLLMVRRPAAHSALPRDHVEEFRYAIRSGALPLASLFSDWSGELAHHRFLPKAVLPCLPAVTCAVLAMNLYGMLMYGEDARRQQWHYKLLCVHNAFEPCPATTARSAPLISK